MRILTDVNIDWLRWRWHSLAFSWVIILAGVFLMATRGVPLGVDFAGGTNIEVRFENPVSDDAIRDALAGVPGDKQIQTYGDPAANTKLIKLPQTSEQEQGTGLEREANAVVAALEAADVGTFEIQKTTIIGPVIGESLQRKGIYATVASLVGIMLYIAFRFRLSFGIGAMIASIHDVLITLSLLTFAGYELSLNVVAAILTLVGYGVNDQIVIFDRVRENLRMQRNQPMNAIINRSVNQTLPRTVITAGTTAMSLLALYLFGGEVLEPFAFAMLVGVITSTYSTVFIASAVAVLLSPRRRVAAAASAAPSASAASSAPAARASAAASTPPATRPGRSKQRKRA